MSESSGVLPNEMDCLLEFLSNYNSWEENEKLFENVNILLTQKLKASSGIVISYPKDYKKFKDKKIDRMCRNVWSRPEDSSAFDKKDVTTVFGKVICKDCENQEELFKYDIKRHSYYAFYYGTDDFQYYLGLFRIPKKESLNEEFLKYLLRFVRNSFVQIQRWKNMEKVNSLIHIDDVTGLYNQRKLTEDLDVHIVKYKEKGEKFSALFMDIDHFKKVNDMHGHMAGTQVLADLGKVLKRVMRESDMLYRYGGDEFVVLVPNATKVIARNIAVRILDVVKKTEFEVEGKPFNIAVSIGVAIFPNDARNGQEVLEMADRMMYCAKKAGRGRVCMATEFFK